MTQEEEEQNSERKSLKIILRRCRTFFFIFSLSLQVEKTFHMMEFYKNLSPPQQWHTRAHLLDMYEMISAISWISQRQFSSQNS